MSVAATYICALLQVYKSNFYLGTVKYMLLELGDSDEVYLQYFLASAMLTVLCIPLLSAAASHLSLANLLHAVTILSLLHAASALVPSLRWQVVTFVLYVPYRSAIFSTGSLYVASVFGFGKLSTVYGLYQSCGALLGFTMPALAALILEVLDGNWAIVLVGYVVVCLPQAAAVSWLAHRHGSAEQEML